MATTATSAAAPKTWVAEVPANGKTKLTYTLMRPKPRKVKDED